jgi:hypothetical protein
MRRTLKLLLLLGIGLALMGKKDGPSGTSGSFDKVEPPPRFKGLQSNSTAENHADADAKLDNGDTDASNSNDPESGTQDDSANSGATGPTGDLKEDFANLPNGENKRVKVVQSEEELRDYFDSWTEDSTPRPPSPPKVTERYILPDGTMIQWRTESDSGGATIDIFPPGGKPQKVHIE